MQTLKGFQAVKPLLELGQTSSVMLKRFRHNINPSRPKMPTWKRKKMLEFAKPVFSIKHPTTEFLWQECPRIEEDKELKKASTPNAHEAIYVKELMKYMESSKMIGLYHFNFVTTRGYRKAWQNARRLKMELETYEHVMVKAGLEGTIFFLKIDRYLLIRNDGKC